MEVAALAEGLARTDAPANTDVPRHDTEATRRMMLVRVRPGRMAAIPVDEVAHIARFPLGALERRGALELARDEQGALPVFTLAFVLTGPIIKMTRQSVLAVVNSDYILYAKAAGYPAKTIRWYMLRNSLSPVITLSGILFGFMLGGAVLIETVFSLGGIGQYAGRSVLAFDYPAIQAVVLVIAAISLFVYLALDVAHALIDPRIVT